MVFVVVGNKCDMEVEYFFPIKVSRKVSYEEGSKFAKDNGCSFMETSCKNGCNVEEMFKIICMLWMEKSDISEKCDQKLNEENKNCVVA